jgi:RNA polymerase sigma-70 factor (sigma-E family)
MEDDGDFSAYTSARWGVLVRSAVVLGCTLEEAHDLVQTTLMRCYTKWAKVKRADDPDAYVYRILLNCQRDSRRRRWWGEQPTDSVPDRRATDATDDLALADAVHRALRDLSQAHREVVVLRYYAHMSEAQTAQFLGVAPGTVKSRHSRAMAQLAASPHLSDVSEGPTS